MEPDHIDESPGRKSIGAYVVAVALGITAAKAALPLWGPLLVGGMVWWGLHMVAGLKIRRSYRD